MGCSASSNVGRWDVYYEGPHKTLGEMYFAKEGETWCLTGMNIGGMPGSQFRPRRRRDLPHHHTRRAKVTTWRAALGVT
jgi:hypothetical protein